MKKLFVLASLILVISFSVTVLAAQENIGVGTTATAVKRTAVAASITAQQKSQIKETVRNYFTPVIHGYGIGFTDDTYITARWQISNVRILTQARVNSLIREAKQGNNTDWDAVRARINTALSSDAAIVERGRIRIDGTDYALVNIVVEDEKATADIVEIPDYTACKNANTTAEACENSSEKVGEISITKKTKANQETAGTEKVWAGVLSLNGVRYTFVTFVYPR